MVINTDQNIIVAQAVNELIRFVLPGVRRIICLLFFKGVGTLPVSVTDQIGKRNRVLPVPSQMAPLQLLFKRVIFEVHSLTEIGDTFLRNIAVRNV